MSSLDVKTMGRMLRGVQDPATKRILQTIIENIDILKSSVGALESPDSLTWFNLKLENSWVQTSTIEARLPTFSKDIFGWVHIRGVISSGTTTDGTTIATIPHLEYRPEVVEIITMVEDAGSGNAHLHINPDGTLDIYGVTGSAEISINGCFYVGN